MTGLYMKWNTGLKWLKRQSADYALLLYTVFRNYNELRQEKIIFQSCMKNEIITVSFQSQFLFLFNFDQCFTYQLSHLLLLKMESSLELICLGSSLDWSCKLIVECSYMNIFCSQFFSQFDLIRYLYIYILHYIFLA